MHFTTLATLVVGSTLMLAQTISGQLVLNGGFESLINIPPGDVTSWPTTTDIVNQIVSDVQAFTGVQSLAVTSLTTAPGSLSQVIALALPGTCYQISLWAYITTTGDSTQITSSVSFGSNLVGAPLPLHLQASATWTNYILYATADLVPILTLTNGNDIGTTYIDDVTMVAVDPVNCLAPSITKRRRNRMRRHSSRHAQW